MTVEQLAQISGIVLSLVLAYFPGVDKWYGGKDSKVKAGIMGALLVVVSGVIFALACARFAADIGLGMACDKSSAIQLVQILIAALIANQATFLLTVKPFKK